MNIVNLRREFRFQLIRYVPDPVRNEFVNIGVLLRGCRSEHDPDQGADLRFTRDWRRVQCIDPDADIALLEDMEADLRSAIQNDSDGQVMKIVDSFALNIQTTEPKAYLAESLSAGLDELMRLYVDSSA